MKGSIQQRSLGSWELTVDLGCNAWGKRQCSSGSDLRHHSSTCQNALTSCLFFLIPCTLW